MSFGQIDTYWMSIGIHTTSVTKIEISCNSKEMTQAWARRKGWDVWYEHRELPTTLKRAWSWTEAQERCRSWVRIPALWQILGSPQWHCSTFTSCCERSTCCMAPMSLLGLLSHSGRETKHSSFPTNTVHLCPYPTTPPKAGGPTWVPMFEPLGHARLLNRCHVLAHQTWPRFFYLTMKQMQGQVPTLSVWHRLIASDTQGWWSRATWAGVPRCVLCITTHCSSQHRGRHCTAGESLNKVTSQPVPSTEVSSWCSETDHNPPSPSAHLSG